MTAKEYLQRARDIEKQINAAMLEACRLRSLAEKATSTFTATKVSGTSHRSRLEDAAIELVMLEDAIVNSIHDLVKIKSEIRDLINKLDNPQEKTVLKLRYLCGKKWEEIAVDTNYGWAQTHRIHSRGLQKIEKMIHNDTL